MPSFEMPPRTLSLIPEKYETITQSKYLEEIKTLKYQCTKLINQIKKVSKETKNINNRVKLIVIAENTTENFKLLNLHYNNRTSLNYNLSELKHIKLILDQDTTVLNSISEPKCMNCCFPF